jgi:hypothetical protein
MTKDTTKGTTGESGDSHTYSFVADEHLKGSIDEVTATLGERKFAELNDLHDAESKAGKRAGMLSAIDGERKTRLTAHESALDIARKSAEAAGAKIYTDEDFEAASGDLRAKVESLTKERDEARAAAAKAASAGARAAPKAQKQPKPRVLEIEGETEIDGATTVAFADANGVTFPALADLQFGEGDFLAGSDGHVLQQRIEFDGTEPESSISAAYLLDDGGKPVAVSRMLQPMRIGGGRKGLLPSGSLRFERGAPAPTPQQAMAQEAGAA